MRKEHFIFGEITYKKLKREHTYKSNKLKNRYENFHCRTRDNDNLMFIVYVSCFRRAHNSLPEEIQLSSNIEFTWRLQNASKTSNCF